MFLIIANVFLLGCSAGSGSSLSVIASENQKPGDPNWVLTNPATEHEIEGYASAASVNRGKQISFFVSTSDPSFRIELFRLGWYGGIGARNMLVAVTLPGLSQATPIPEPISGLIECHWQPSYSMIVPADSDPTNWASGVYVAKLTALPSNKQSYIIFIVRDDTRSSTYLFQSSVTTFQAYNNWGGKSLYDYNSAGGRAAKVSFSRPYASGSQSGAASGIGAGEFLTTYVPQGVSFPAGWEYNMVRFLERNGYDVTYISDLDTHERPSLLSGHKTFLVVGHDEYWSQQMRDNVTRARDTGINLAFFAANVCYWQIRLEPSALTGELDRTEVCYKDTTDPTAGPLQTLQWRQLGMPESALVGVMYVTDRVDSSIEVDNATTWAFDGTGLSDGAFLPGLLGYEVDAISTSSPPNLVILANSPFQLLGHPVQYSQMITYTAASSATVFATGSMQWSWGLDDYNAPELRPSVLSRYAQQITRNVLRKLGNN